LVLAGCEFHDAGDDWHDQLVPDSPCYRVDLLDGLSEASTDELHDLYDCLDQGNFTALGGLVDALDEPARGGDPAGIELARLVNDLPAAGLDLAAMLDAAVTLLHDESQPIMTTAHWLVELIYGQPYAQLALSEPSLEAEALQAGLVEPALPLLGSLAGVILDEDNDPALFLAELLGADLTLDALATFTAAAGSEQEPLLSVREDLLRLAGAALLATEDTSNDHLQGGTGSSLRDAALVLSAQPDGDETVMGQLLVPASTLLDDPQVSEALIAAISRDYREGHLQALAAQITILATEDVDGDSLQLAEDSALVSLVRLLYIADRPVSCSTLGIEWLSTDNLSVWLLELIAEQEPDNVDFLLDIGGWTLSYGSLVEAVAGECTVDSAQFTADAPSLERLVDPQVGDLLVILLDLLQALQPQGGTSRIPELVDILSLSHANGLVAPAEELLKDIGDTQLVSLVVDLVPPLVDPWSEQAWCADGTDSCLEEYWAGYSPEDFSQERQPMELAQLLALAGRALQPGESGRSPAARCRPLALQAVHHDATWELTSNAGILLATPGALSSELLAALPAYQQLDPDWKLLSTSAVLLEDSSCVTPAMRLVETEPVLAAVATTSPDDEGPLPFFSRLVLDDTLAEVLATMKLVLDFLMEARS